MSSPNEPRILVPSGRRVVKVHVVGIGLDGAAGLSESARQVVEMAALLIGSERHLSYFPQHDEERWALEDLTEAILEIRRWWATEPELEPSGGTVEPRDQLIVILVAGDPAVLRLGKVVNCPITDRRIDFSPPRQFCAVGF